VQALELLEHGRRDPVNEIPAIDLGGALPGNAARISTASGDLCSALYNVGFAVLHNHGIDAVLRRECFSLSAALFALPIEEKMRMVYTTTDRNRGYIANCRESLEGTGSAGERMALAAQVQPDLKESFDIGSVEDTAWQDTWPGALMPAFRDQFWALRRQLDQVHAVVMRSLAIGLGVPEDSFEPFFDRREYSLRLLHYPSAPAGSVSDTGQKRAGTHTDYNHLTLLLQDSVGGLQVLNAADQWVDVRPDPEAIIVNTGDLMERWTNGLFKATVHRVLDPVGTTSDARLCERYSMAYFVKPNRDATIECLPVCCDARQPPKYLPVNCFEFVNAAFKKANNESPDSESRQA